MCSAIAVYKLVMMVTKWITIRQPDPWHLSIWCGFSGWLGYLTDIQYHSVNNSYSVEYWLEWLLTTWVYCRFTEGCNINKPWWEEGQPKWKRVHATAPTDWFICYKWNNSSMLCEKVLDMKESYSLQVVESSKLWSRYRYRNTFHQWIPHTFNSQIKDSVAFIKNKKSLCGQMPLPKK